MGEANSLGLPRGQVIVVAPDPRWPELYTVESERIAQVLGASGQTVRLEHTGSTAVPGLPAKPIIDILAGRDPCASRAEVIDAIVGAGYQYRGEQGIPGRDFFRRGDPRSYHLHLTEIGSAFWQDHVDFRDYLRANASARDEYAAVKRELAARYPSNREAYIDGKAEVVLRLLRAARAV
jgi:GrpB-like predicted nucleotidyltransferase (UPF0157 family)